MTMVKCRECGGSVSTEAPKCPHCGVFWMKSAGVPVSGKVGGILLILVGIVAVWSIITPEGNAWWDQMGVPRERRSLVVNGIATFVVLMGISLSLAPTRSR